MVRIMQTEGCTVAILRDLIPFGGGTGEFEKDGVAIWISLLGSYVTGLLRTEPGLIGGVWTQILEKVST
jgi:hypothetical protein